MANQVYSSPGVYTSEKDLTFTTETVGVTTLGLVGETLKGPAFQPMFITNFDNFKIKFGGTSPEKFNGTQIVKYELPYIAKSYLSQTNQLFVTRVLGLSGYKAGMAYAIRTIGTVDQTSLSETLGSPITIDFVANLTGNTLYVSGTTTPLLTAVSSATGVDASKFSAAFNNFFSLTSYTTKNWYLNNVLYWNLLNTADRGTITTARNTKSLSGSAPATPLYIDSYVLPSSIPTADETNYIFANEFAYNEGADKYNSAGLALYAANFSVGGTKVTGKLYVYATTFHANPIPDFHKKTVCTLRSRGSYIVDKLIFNITGNTIGLSNTTVAQTNPLASFDITGLTANGVSFDYNVSLDPTQGNYVKKVLGTGAYDKTTNVFVEELYDSAIAKGYTYGKIKGLHYSILPLNTWSHLEFQYQSPMTPFFVSELRGGLPQRLFRLVSISDGNSANTEIKTSIANVNLDNLTFDVYIRAYGDSDKSPLFLEKFIGLTMDETQSNYIGRRIGTIDNKYPLISSYVVADMDPSAPTDAIPAGFEGYDFRTNGTLTGITDDAFAGVIQVPYKTKYYNAGETIVTPPLSVPIISAGDRMRKVYLGFTDTEYGYDADLLAFKGQQSLGGNTYNSGLEWGTKTTGFHLDVNAGTILNPDGSNAFTAGVGTFTNATVVEGDPTHPYYNILSRKFTALFSGGFDGWDIYRKSRTNTNDYKIGRSSFVRANFAQFSNAQYSEMYGTFGASDYYATFLAILTYQNPEETTINILATPGIDIVNNTDLCFDTIEIIEEKRMDAIYLPTLPDINLYNNSDPSNTDNWLYPQDVIDVLNTTNIDSNYTAVYYPWIQIADTDNNANLFVPPTLEIVRNLAYTDNVAYPWFATAGYNRGIVNCIRARMPLDQNARDILYPARINPIATFSDVGTVIWGNRNLQVKNSAMNRLNIRRLLLQARRLIVSVSNRLLFDPNDETIRSQFLAAVNPILDNIRKERGLTDFRVSLTASANETDRNTMTGKIYIKPTPTLEFIELQFVVTPTNVSFDNVT